jgi:hypothetical protein
MARQKHPKLNDLVRRGVEAEDLDEMHYEEEQCPSTLTNVPKVTRGMRSVPSRGRKPPRNRAERVLKQRMREDLNSPTRTSPTSQDERFPRRSR